MHYWISTIHNKLTRYFIWTSTLRFIKFFKKRQHLITISGDEFGIFHFKGQRYLNSWKLGPLFKGISQASFGPIIVEKWSSKVFDKAVELVIETPIGLNSLTQDMPDLWEVLAHWWPAMFYAGRHQFHLICFYKIIHKPARFQHWP